MNRKRRRTHSPPGTGGVTRRAGVVVKSKWFSLIPMNKWGGELFDSSTTPALRTTPPVPGGELFLPLLQFIHSFYVRAYKGRMPRYRILQRVPIGQSRGRLHSDSVGRTRCLDLYVPR